MMGQQMMQMGMMGGNMFWMVIFWAAVLSLLVWLGLALYRRFEPHAKSPMGQPPDALALLNERLARGEISPEEYQKLLLIMRH